MLSWVIFIAGFVSATPNFQTIWNSQGGETVALLRMVGVIYQEDWNQLSADDKQVLLEAFDDQGNLNSFGRRLLQELKSAQLKDPNRLPTGKAKVSDDLAFKADAMKKRSKRGGLTQEQVLDLSARPFLGQTVMIPLPLVYPGMHDWAQPLSQECFVSKSQKPGSLETQNVRVLITPKTPVRVSRYNVHQDPNYESLTSAALAETGIDPKVLDKYQARLVSTLSLFNLVTIEVPKKNAKDLALALEAKQVYSRPANTVRLLDVPAPSAQSAQSGGLVAALRLAVGAVQGGLAKTGAPIVGAGQIDPMLDSSVGMLNPGKFYQAGIHGEEAVFVLVDSGLDKNHPDFAGKTVTQKDFSDDKDNRDYVGHGTHVASTALGTGAASDGKYRGVAYGTKEIFVAKVFGKSPSASEDTILAGLDWGVNQAKGRKVVINMSLGGSGDANDPLARASNMLAHQGHSVVVAAGNSGPGEGSVSSPGVARDAITVAATDKQGYITEYSSRGSADGYKTPAREKFVYSKPDIAAPGGDINRAPRGLVSRWFGAKEEEAISQPQTVGDCRYGPGIIAAKSSDMAAGPCDIIINGKALYTRMAGTSMATPHMAGVNLLVNDTVVRAGGSGMDTALQSKAAQMEAARQLKESNGKVYARTDQGAGMAELGRLFDLVSSRLSQGLPVGNISAGIAFEAMTDTKLKADMRLYTSYRATQFGIVSVTSGNVINSDDEMVKLVEKIKKEKNGDWFLKRWWRKYFGKESKKDVLEK